MVLLLYIYIYIYSTRISQASEINRIRGPLDARNWEKIPSGCRGGKRRIFLFNTQWSKSWMRKKFFEGQPGALEHVLPSGNLLHSYWKWWFIVDFPIENGECQNSELEAMAQSKVRGFSHWTWWFSFHSYVNVYQRVLSPMSWDDDPIWRTHIFQGGWKPPKLGI